MVSLQSSLFYTHVHKCPVERLCEMWKLAQYVQANRYCTTMCTIYVQKDEQNEMTKPELITSEPQRLRHIVNLNK